MPELCECISHYLFVRDMLNHKNAEHADTHLCGIWADWTQDEIKEHSVYKYRFRVKRVTPKQHLLRGAGRTRKSPLWPVGWSTGNLTLLSLQDVQFSPRGIVLDFGLLYFYLAFLTHTSVQCVARNKWMDEIATSSQRDRGFHIAIAFEFHEFFLIFPSNDLLFQPYWASDRSLLPVKSFNIHIQYCKFLSDVARWIDKRKQKKNCLRNGLACEVIREEEEVWGGVGVYTVCELFFDAGLSLFLTEKEVFDCPSRTARLCEALWCYVHRSWTGLWGLVRPALHDGMLAPTLDQRLRYLNWLHVFAKDRTRVPQRMGELLDRYLHSMRFLDIQCVQNRRKHWYREGRIASVTLFDVFEPAFLEEAFDKAGGVPNLGHLIFGEANWRRLRPSASIPEDAVNMDPLTLFYQMQPGIDLSQTHLKPDHYSMLLPDHERARTLFPAQQHSRTGDRYLCPELYRVKASNKQLWSISPPYSDRSLAIQANKISSALVRNVTEDEKRKLLFRYKVTKTRLAAVGPLEYCGNASIALTPHREFCVSAIRKPRALVLQGKQKRTTSSESTTPLKRQYLSADKAIVAAGNNLDYLCDRDKSHLT
ncbi:hypothetical protein AN958_03741 [Leucoagaricus sp. SymC.cos]|nr:hypothetical protein AN958_03741 [Leucoagaricus sp. SymC.cos]